MREISDYGTKDAALDATKQLLERVNKLLMESGENPHVCLAALVVEAATIATAIGADADTLCDGIKRKMRSIARQEVLREAMGTNAAEARDG